MREKDARPVNVLLVEDEPGDAALIRRALGRSSLEHFNVTWVETLAEGSQSLAREQYDLVLLDLSLPDCSGLDTVRAGCEAAGDIPLVVLTGRDDPEFALSTLDAGAQDYLVKGEFDHNLLIRSLRYALARVRAEEELQRRGQEFRALAENAPDIVLRFDRDLRCLYINPAIEKHTGIPREQFAGHINEALGMAAEQVQLWKSTLQDVFREGREKEMFFDYLTPTGHKHYHSRITPEIAPDGTVETVLAINRDITAIKEMEASRYQEYQLQFEKMVAEVSNIFLSAAAANIEAAYADGLRRLGEFFAVDRCYLFQLNPDGKTMENLSEWCAPGITARRVKDIFFKLDDFPWWAERVRRHEHVCIPAAELLPPDVAAEKQELARQEIKSLFTIPLVTEGQLLGFIGFDTVNQQKEWTERQIGLLKLVAESISAALAKIKAEQKTLEANLRLLTVLEGMDAKVNVVDIKSYEILFINRSGQELFGDVVGQTCWQVMHEGQTGPCAFCSIDKLLDTAGYPAGEYRWEYQDTKTNNWYECCDTALRWFDGRMVRLQIATDITARKRTETALQETLERLDSLLENTPNPIAILDGDGRFVEISAAAARKIGLSREAARGKTYSELFSAELAASFRQAIAELQQKQQIITKTTAIPGGDGTTIYESWFFPVKQNASAIELVGTIMLDITELKRSQQEALQASRIKSEFVATISHELRTPLHAILNYADFGREESGVEGREELEEYFQKIQYSGTRLLHLINDLLDISRIEAGSVEYNFRQQDLYELVLLAGGELATLLQEKELELEVIKPAFDTAVKADRDRILQVLRNLIHNALKFSPRGSTIKITCIRNLAAPPALVELHIVDAGPGIPPQDLDVIFDRFKQSGKAIYKTEGTGLGLAICREIIQAHGGRIYAANEPQQGARLTFNLPLLDQ